ncbi:MAG: MFS transporter [Solirubrobacterales bacterium]|nr:MFS transporter [Solirubrobacterales bacterium]
MALLSLSLSYLMVILDALIVNVALPSIGRDLGGGLSALQWTVDAYTLVFAALLLPAGALGDRLSARRLFELGLVWFTLWSAVCAAAPSVGILVAARALQGVGAAVTVPTGLALLRAQYAEPRARARAIGIWGTTAGIGAAGGPILGGVLTGLLGWRSVFIVNVPVGLFAIWAAHRAITVAGEREGGGIDPAGQLTAVLTLGLLALGVIDAGRAGLGALSAWGPLALALVTGAVFLLLEARGRAPMLELGLFRSASLSAGTVVGFCINFGLYGQLFATGLFFQQALGYSPLAAGLALLPEGACVMAFSMFSGSAVGRFGPRKPMLAGLAAGTVGFAGLALCGGHPAYWELVAPLLVAGAGMSTTMVATTNAVISAAPGNRAGAASAVLNASRQVGSMVGVALAGSLLGAGAAGAGLVAAMVASAVGFGFALLVALRWVERLSHRSARQTAPPSPPRAVAHTAPDADRVAPGD